MPKTEFIKIRHDAHSVHRSAIFLLSFLCITAYAMLDAKNTMINEMKNEPRTLALCI